MPVLVFLLALLIALPATAQSICVQHADMLSGLEEYYNEMPSTMGLTKNGNMVEILTSPNGETWTIIVTLPNGTSCLIAVGENWETVPRVLQRTTI